MSPTTDRDYTVVRISEAFVQRLSGNKLRKGQERLAFGLVRHNSLVPAIETRSGIGPQHFPADLRALFDAAKTMTHEQIKEIVVSQPEGEIAQTYKKGVDFLHGEA